ncbi:hypothetical protein YIM_08490 [Amycolatopsis sp. YIM 10]|nr:hypothetical protein YIM_08490 [Amycolatopsis sp. YIM 10]
MDRSPADRDRRRTPHRRCCGARARRGSRSADPGAALAGPCCAEPAAALAGPCGTSASPPRRSPRCRGAEPATVCGARLGNGGAEPAAVCGSAGDMVVLSPRWVAALAGDVRAVTPARPDGAMVAPEAGGRPSPQGADDRGHRRCRREWTVPVPASAYRGGGRGRARGWTAPVPTSVGAGARRGGGRRPGAFTGAGSPRSSGPAASGVFATMVVNRRSAPAGALGGTAQPAPPSDRKRRVVRPRLFGTGLQLLHARVTDTPAKGSGDDSHRNFIDDLARCEQNSGCANSRLPRSGHRPVRRPVGVRYATRG